jgi:acetyltransferase-like isoleucine patch superfamily enzyme
MREDVFIHPTAEVDPSAAIGPGTKIWHFAQVRERARIGCHCVLGKDVYVDHDVRIGDYVKIQNGVSVYYGVTLEDETFVGPNATFTNDLYPRSCAGNWEVVPTLVRRGASIAASATILCGLTLGEFCMVGAGAVVTEDVAPYTLVAGNPARPFGYVCPCGRRAERIPGADPPIIRCGTCGREVELTEGIADF